jgi:hypothetical protein
MSVRKFMPVNRLAKALNDPTGLLMSQALKHAGSNLEKVRPQLVASLDRKLDALRDLAPIAEEAREEFYRTAREVYADAGALGFVHMSQAALSLCDLFVAVVPEARFRAGIKVHVDAIMALRSAAGDAAKPQREAILKGLFAISGKTA